MRVALVDPLSYTPPYDDGLAHALAGRGHEVTLLAGPFLHGSVPEPVGYTREEIFLPVTGRLFRPLPRSRLRLLLKGVEYLPSASRLVNRLEALEPDVVHVQWLPRPELDRRWLRRLPAPSVLTAHDVMPRRERARAIWPEVLASFGRVVVHSEAAVRQLGQLGVDATRIAHPVFEALEPAAPPTGATLLFFGLIRDYKGLDVLVPTFRAPGSSSPATRSTRSSRRALPAASSKSTTGSNGASATSRTPRCRGSSSRRR
jgi:glycosyltransferase involved in cell wall biosynthesis